MKTSQLIFPLVVALAAVMATTGCKHGFTKTTYLPGVHQPPVMPPDTDPSTRGSGNFGSEPTQVTSIPVDPRSTGIPTTPRDLSNYTQDRTPLAANTVHFKFDSYVVLDNEQSNISSVAQYLAANANDKLLIEGHCDERGTDEYNRALGERRALALREALSKVGVAADRVFTKSFGKDQPADSGHDEAAWSKNRRGEFVVCHPKM